MQVTSITNNYDTQYTNFKAGKIKVLNPQAWTDAELRAFSSNDEFKALAKKLKKQKMDLFVSVDKVKDKVENRVLSLFCGKNDNPEKLIHKIVGPIWNCTPEKRSLIDNIVLFPLNIETLFNSSDSSLTKEKKKIAKELAKKNINIKVIDYWHLSELKALRGNKQFEKLAKQSDLEGNELYVIRDFSDFLNGNYIEVYNEFSNIGSIYPRNYDYNSSSTITDAITNFDDFVFKSPDEIKKEALIEIEDFNKKQDASKKSIWNFIKNIFTPKAR